MSTDARADERPEEAPRRVVGLMSGTSLDGIDAACVRLAGHGRALRLDVEGFATTPFAPALADALTALVTDATAAGGRVALPDLLRLDVRLARAYAAAVRAACAEAGCAVADVDLVGSHGQTVLHLPAPHPAPSTDTPGSAPGAGGAPVRATLQLGCPSTLAQTLGVPVVADFRRADLALGGQGAPLAPYLDDALFADAHATRLLLNLGGIANVTVLPAGAGPDAVRAFDTGPANMVIDACARACLGAPYDAGGRHAAAGTPDMDLVADLLADPYFAQPPPKSTGRAHFGAAFARRLLDAAAARGLGDADTLATATALTAASVYQAYARFVRADAPADVVLASGGGVHNAALMDALARAFAPVPVRTTAAYGLDPDAKEAVCFAVLAHERAAGVPASLPGVTGATRAAVLGVVARP